LSLTYVHGYDFRDGLRYIRSLTSKPVGINFIIEKSSKKYLQRVHQWVDIALEEEIPFFVTALGNPRWVVDKARPAGITVYHDVTDRRWAEKALEGGVDGLICVNNRAGGHAGTLSPQQLLDELAPLGKPLICAGGIGKPEEFADAIRMGYSGAQLGTRFIATQECNAHPDYKNAILHATEHDIVLSEKISGVPVAIIRTPYIEHIGTKAGPIAKWMLKGRKTKHWMRAIYSLQSIWKLKHSSMQGANYKDYFQAGKSVSGIQDIQSVAAIVSDYVAALETDG
jgi:nitronate monooxygenase